MPSPANHKRALVACALLGAVLAVNLVMRSQHPLATLGGWATDHASHTGGAVLFAHHGFDIFTKPVRSLCPEPVDAADWVRLYQIYPGQICRPAGADPGDRPLVVNWPEHPRLYPPGATAYAALEAVLYSVTPLSFHAINRVTVIKYLFAALAAWLVFFVLVRGFVAQEPLTWLLLALVGSELLRWALTGFHDGLSVGLVFATVALLRKERNAAALLAYGLAFLLHYRALWFAPLAALALVRLVRAGGTRALLRWPDGAMVSGGLLAIIGSAGFLIAGLRYSERLEHNNPLRTDQSIVGAADLLVVLALALPLLVRDRAWIVLAVLTSQLGTLFFTPEVRPWHGQFALGLLAVAYLPARPRVRVVTFAIVVVEMVAVFRNPGMPGWVRGVLTGTF